MILERRKRNEKISNSFFIYISFFNDCICGNSKCLCCCIFLRSGIRFLWKIYCVCFNWKRYFNYKSENWDFKRCRDILIWIYGRVEIWILKRFFRFDYKCDMDSY